MIRTTMMERWRIGQVNWLQLGANLALAGVWLVLYRPVFDYLATVFTREDFRTNQLVLIGILVLIGLQMRGSAVRPRLDAAPRLRWPAFLLALGASAGFRGGRAFPRRQQPLRDPLWPGNLWPAWAVDAAGALAQRTARGSASDRRAALWRPPADLRRLSDANRHGGHRAGWAGCGRRAFGRRRHDPGLRERHLSGRRAVQRRQEPVDGHAFPLAATWIQRKPINPRWLLVAAIFAGLLFAVNLARVAVLVTVGQVAGLQLMAEMLHVPLGVLGFGAACAAAVFLLNHLVGDANHADSRLAKNEQTVRAGWLTPTLIATIGLMAVSTRRGRWLPPAHRRQPGNFPAALSTQPLPLTPKERDWLMGDGAESAERWRFEWRGLSGSMIVVTSRTWRAHHRPERCFEVYGLTLDDSRTHLVNSEFPLRFVALGDGKDPSMLSASYWFQSAGRTTDDYGTRIWSDLSPQRERWVLMSILFDGVVDPNSEDVASLYEALHGSVAQSLAEPRHITTNGEQRIGNGE